MYFWKYIFLSKFNWLFQYPSRLAFLFVHLVWSFLKHTFLIYTLASDPSELDRIRVTYFITWFEPPYCVIFHLLQRRISPVGEDGWKKLLNTYSWKFAQKKFQFCDWWLFFQVLQQRIIQRGYLVTWGDALSLSLGYVLISRQKDLPIY